MPVYSLHIYPLFLMFLTSPLVSLQQRLSLEGVNCSCSATLRNKKYQYTMTEYIAQNRATGTSNLLRPPSLPSTVAGEGPPSRGNTIGRKGSAKTSSDDEWERIFPRQSHDAISPMSPQPYTSATYPRTGFNGSTIVSKGGDSLDDNTSSRKRRGQSGSRSHSLSRSRGAKESKANHQEARKPNMEEPLPVTFVQPVPVSPIPPYTPPQFPRENFFVAEQFSQFQNRTTPLYNGLEAMGDIIAWPKRPLPSRRTFEPTAVHMSAPPVSMLELPILPCSNTGGVEPIGVDGSEGPPSPPAPLLENTHLRRSGSVASNTANNSSLSHDLDKPSASPQVDISPFVGKKTPYAGSNVVAGSPPADRARPPPPLLSVSAHRHGVLLDGVLNLFSHRKASSCSPPSTQGFQLPTLEGSPILPHEDEASNYPFTRSARQAASSYLSQPLQQRDTQASTLARNTDAVAGSIPKSQRKSIVDGYSSDDMVVYVAPGAKGKRATSNPRRRSWSRIGITEGKDLARF